MKAADDIGRWAAAQLPRLDGNHALVTGGASGIGLATVRGLAALGARVTIADVNADAADAALRMVRQQVPQADIYFLRIDLADLNDVRRFTGVWGSAPLDILVNNAGILPPLQRRTTAAGHELAFAISVLGHFALTAQLLPALHAGDHARVVWVTSLVHRRARMAIDDLHGTQDYEAQRAYNQCKLASLMLAVEMQRQALAADSPVRSLAAHPGVARTAIGESRRGQRRQGLHDHLTDAAFVAVMALLGQPADVGARALLLAAAGPDAVGGTLLGPGGIGEVRGAVRVLEPAAPAQDAALRSRLWQACEGMTDEHFRW